MKESKLPTARDLIAKIIPNQANFEHCGKHRTINGSLLLDIERAIESHTQAHTEVLRERVKELEEKNRVDGSRWAKDRVEQGKKHEADMMEACGRIVELEDKVKELEEIIVGINSCQMVGITWPNELKQKVEKIWEAAE